MTAVLLGLVFMAFGVWGLVHWFAPFLVMLQGLVPVSLFLGGLVALVAGVSSLTDRGVEKK